MHPSAAAELAGPRILIGTADIVQGDVLSAALRAAPQPIRNVVRAGSLSELLIAAGAGEADVILVDEWLDPRGHAAAIAALRAAAPDAPIVLLRELGPPGDPAGAQGWPGDVVLTMHWQDLTAPLLGYVIGAMWTGPCARRATADTATRAILDAMPAPAAVLSPGGRITLANQAWITAAAAHGPEVADGGLDSNFLAVLDAAASAGATDAAVIARGARDVLDRHATTFEHIYPCHSPAERRWFRLSLTPHAPDGEAAALMTHWDVTSAALTAETMNQLEQQHDLLFNSSARPIWLCEAGGLQVVVANAAALSAMGGSAADVIGRPLRTLLPDDRQADATDQAPPARWVAHSATGRILALSLEPERVHLYQRDIQLVSAEDITDRRLAESEAADSRERYESLVHSIDGVVWEYDPETARFTFVSRRAEAVLGVAAQVWMEEVDFWSSRIHPVDREAVITARNHAAARREPHALEYRLIHADGHAIWVRDIATLLICHGRVRLVGMLMDITESRGAEAALRESKEQLFQAQKMEAIGLLASGIAHDFNNLLTTVLAGVEVLAADLVEHDPRHSELEAIRESALRGANLTRQLLTFSRRQVQRPLSLDIPVTARSLTGLLQRLVGERITLRQSHMRDGLTITLDPSKFDQIIMNLAVNARDAMPSGGTLVLMTDEVEIVQEAALRRLGLPSGTYAELLIEDSGLGMDEATRSHIFEPFFTTKSGGGKTGGGTGLGLSTVYAIVQQAGGAIEVWSEVGRGTTFRLLFPLAESLVTAPAAPPALAPMQRGWETILLVDDDLPLLRLGSRALGLAGYLVLTCDTPAEAMSLAASHAGPIHLLATDVMMPGMTGPELAQRIEQLRPGIRVLFCSGHAEIPDDQRRLMHTKPVLQKPFSPCDLSRAVRVALE